MYKDVLQGIDNIAIWPVISFIIFFLFFVGLLVYVYKVDTSFITRMKNLPMDDTAPLNQDNNLNRSNR